MNDFIYNIRQLALKALRTHFRREPEPHADPLTDLITQLLEDGAGGIVPPEQVAITTQQWLTWNRLVADHPLAVARIMNQILMQEHLPLPEEITNMRVWAARVVLETLDRMGML